MKALLHSSLACAVLAAGLVLPARAAEPAGGQIDFGTFTPPASGGEFVEVHIRSNLISMAARLAEKAEPEIADLLRGLKTIRVNVIGLDDHNRADLEQRIKSIRGQLEAGGWERIVTAQQGREDVGVYLKTRGEEAVEGVVVTVLEGTKEAVLVNIVGDIRPEKLVTLGERFDIEPLKKLGPGLKKDAAK